MYVCFSDEPLVKKPKVDSQAVKNLLKEVKKVMNPALNRSIDLNRCFSCFPLIDNTVMINMRMCDQCFWRSYCNVCTETGKQTVMISLCADCSRIY